MYAFTHAFISLPDSKSASLSFLRTRGLWPLDLGEPESSPYPHPQPFVAEYCKFPMFHSGEGRHRVPDLSEFDDAREEVASLSADYRAFEALPPEG